MFDLDHVAIQTPDIPRSVAYYVNTFGAVVEYADDTWAFLRLGRGKLALVKPEQHPGHIALRTDHQTLAQTAAAQGLTIQTHRDGTRGLYLQDPAGNTVELICYPERPADHPSTQARAPRPEGRGR